MHCHLLPVTLAIQSCLKTGFLRAVQVEHLVMIGKEGPISLRNLSLKLSRASSASKPKVCHFLPSSLHFHSARGSGCDSRRPSIKASEVRYEGSGSKIVAGAPDSFHRRTDRRLLWVLGMNHKRVQTSYGSLDCRFV